MEDSVIVQLYWDRDQRAISETAAKYGSYCTYIARNILDNAEDAEECVNDAYMNAWNSIPPHKPDILSAYLAKLTRNVCFNRYKYNHAQKRGGSEVSAVLEELSELISGDRSVEQQIESDELSQAIDSFLDTLPQKKRTMFVCRYWYSDSVSEIAKQLGMKENAVSMALSRTRLKLQQYLTERGFAL